MAWKLPCSSSEQAARLAEEAAGDYFARMCDLHPRWGASPSDTTKVFLLWRQDEEVAELSYNRDTLPSIGEWPTDNRWLFQSVSYPGDRPSHTWEIPPPGASTLILPDGRVKWQAERDARVGVANSVC